MLVGKEISPEDKQSYPLTSFPLALSDPSGKLEQVQKATLKIFLISKSEAMTGEAPIDADWIHDDMALFRALPLKSTWEE